MPDSPHQNYIRIIKYKTFINEKFSTQVSYKNAFEKLLSFRVTDRTMLKKSGHEEKVSSRNRHAVGSVRCLKKSSKQICSQPWLNFKMAQNLDHELYLRWLTFFN